jgi:hypothetical protein
MALCGFDCVLFGDKQRQECMCCCPLAVRGCSSVTAAPQRSLSLPAQLQQRPRVCACIASARTNPFEDRAGTSWALAEARVHAGGRVGMCWPVRCLLQVPAAPAAAAHAFSGAERVCLNVNGSPASAGVCAVLVLQAGSVECCGRAWSAQAWAAILVPAP